MIWLSNQYNKKIVLSVNLLMSRWCALLLISSIPCFCYSQIGVNARYLFGNSDILDWNDFSRDGIHVSLEYNFRLKEKRLEFRPGIGYRFTGTGESYYGHIKSVDLDFGASVYPFDFSGDCDCPTFSKEGGLFKKGFFIELVPGVANQTLSRIRNHSINQEGLPVKSRNILWKLGGAAGLDIGITEHFTLTPLFSVTLLSTSTWESLQEDNLDGILSDYTYLGTGLRITYNADDKKRRRRN